MIRSFVLGAIAGGAVVWYLERRERDIRDIVGAGSRSARQRTADSLGVIADRLEAAADRLEAVKEKLERGAP